MDRLASTATQSRTWHGVPTHAGLLGYDPVHFGGDFRRGPGPIFPRFQIDDEATVGEIIACAKAAWGTGDNGAHGAIFQQRSEEHTSELQSLMRISYAVFCLKKKKNIK